MKKKCPLIVLCIGLFALSGCKTQIDVNSHEKSLGHQMIYDGFELDQVYLSVSDYDAINEPGISLNTEFVEYERRVDEIETWKRDTKYLMYLSGFTLNSHSFKSIGPRRKGPLYDIDHYTKTGEREKKHSRSDAKLPETVFYELVDFDFTVHMPNVTGNYAFSVDQRKTLLDMVSLRVKFPFEEESRALSLSEFHQAYRDHVNLKSRRAKQQVYDARQREQAQQEEARKSRAITQHKGELATQSSKVSSAISDSNWKSAVSLQKELIALLQGSADNRPSKEDLTSAYEALIEYASESGDFDEITAAMELHKKAHGE